MLDDIIIKRPALPIWKPPRDGGRVPGQLITGQLKLDNSNRTFQIQTSQTEFEMSKLGQLKSGQLKPKHKL